MKKKLAIVSALLLSVIVTVAVVSDIGIAQYVVINNSTTVPIQVTNGVLTCQQVTLVARKAPQTDNTGTIYIGFGVSADGAQGYDMAPGTKLLLSVPTGRGFSLSNIWFDVSTAGDGLLVIYE